MVASVKNSSLRLVWPVLLLAGCVVPAGQTPSTDDAGFAANLWQSLTEARLVGPQSIQTRPHPGLPSHGTMVQVFDARLTVEGQTAPVLILRNHDGPDIGSERVMQNPERYLQSIAVMFRRVGFAPDDSDWFWVVYRPNGSPMASPDGRPLLGRPEQGCIVCHRAAPGGDRVFGHDRFAR